MARKISTKPRKWMHDDVATDIAVRACEALGVVFWALAPHGDVWATDWENRYYLVTLGRARDGVRTASLYRWIAAQRGALLTSADVAVAGRRQSTDLAEWALFGDADTDAVEVSDQIVEAEAVEKIGAELQTARKIHAETMGRVARVKSTVDTLTEYLEAVASGARRRYLPDERTHAANASSAIDGLRSNLPYAQHVAWDAATNAGGMAESMSPTGALTDRAIDLAAEANTIAEQVRAAVDTLEAYCTRVRAAETLARLGEAVTVADSARANRAEIAREGGELWMWEYAIDAAKAWHAARVEYVAAARVAIDADARTDADAKRWGAALERLAHWADFAEQVIEQYRAERSAMFAPAQDSPAPLKSDAPEIVGAAPAPVERFIVKLSSHDAQPFQGAAIAFEIGEREIFAHGTLDAGLETFDQVATYLAEQVHTLAYSDYLDVMPRATDEDARFLDALDDSASVLRAALHRDILAVLADGRAREVLTWRWANDGAGGGHDRRYWVTVEAVAPLEGCSYHVEGGPCDECSQLDALAVHTRYALERDGGRVLLGDEQVGIEGVTVREAVRFFAQIGLSFAEHAPDQCEALADALAPMTIPGRVGEIRVATGALTGPPELREAVRIALDEEMPARLEQTVDAFLADVFR